MWPMTTGHFQMVPEQKKEVEVMATNLHFPLFVQKKLQTSPLSLVSFLIFSYCTIRKWPIGFSVSLVFGKRCFNLNFTASKNKSYSDASGKIYAVNLSQSARKLVYLHHKRIKMTKNKRTNHKDHRHTRKRAFTYQRTFLVFDNLLQNVSLFNPAANVLV